MITQLYLVFFAFLLGSIPTGLILSFYFTEIDVRQAGSGNIGATNVTRLTGKKLGALTLLGDALKGSLAVLLALHIMDSPFGVSLVALSVFLGHCYSVFLNFNGGKGVAVAFGDFLVLAPGAALLALLVWLLVFYRLRRSSLGALIAAPLLLLFVALIPAYRAYAPLTLAIVVFMILRHKDNIDRLLRGTER